MHILWNALTQNQACVTVITKSRKKAIGLQGLNTLSTTSSKTESGNGREQIQLDGYACEH